VILGGILLALIGLADLVRSSLAGDTGAGAAPGGARNRGAHVRTSFAVATTAILWLVVCVLAVGGLGVPVWLVAIPVVLAAGWLATTSAAAATRTPAGIAPAVGVLVALLATLVWDNSTARLNGFVADWHRLTPASVLADVPLPALVVGSGVALFLIESANIVVRAALRPTASEPAAVTDATPHRGADPCGCLSRCGRALRREGHRAFSRDIGGRCRRVEGGVLPCGQPRELGRGARPDRAHLDSSPRLIIATY
jgi:nitrate reductase NapE component